MLGPLANSSLFAIVSTTDSAKDSAIYCERGGGSDIYKLDQVAGTGFRFVYRNDLSVLLFQQVTDSTSADGRPHAVMITKDGTTHAAYSNGASSSGTFGGTAAFTNGVTRTVGFDFSDAAAHMAGVTDLIVGFSRTLSAAEFASLRQNPWQLFAPLPRRIWAPAAAGGGTSISGALGTASASGFKGNVNANRSLTGALGTATASGFKGTVNANRTIAGALGVAAASGFQGGIGANRGIAGALGTAVASGFQGTVSNSNSTTITGALGTAVASGFTGGIVWNRSIAGLLGTAQASGFNGGVSNGAPVIAGGGGWFPMPRRRTKKEIDDERRALGILPPEVVAEVAAAPVARRRITLQDLIGKKAAAQITSVDLSEAIAASKKRKRRQDDELLLLM